MSHKFILEFGIRGNKKKPKSLSVGRFTSMGFNYPNIIVKFETEADPSEKLYDIIEEINNFTEINPYKLNEPSKLNDMSKIKYLYLDTIIFDDKQITVEEIYKKKTFLLLPTNMFNSSIEGENVELEIFKI